MTAGPSESDVASEIEQATRAMLLLSLRAVEGHSDITATGVRALLVLDQVPDVNIAQLATHLGLSPSAASRMIDRLVMDGLIERSERPEDRRQVTLRVTRRGRRSIIQIAHQRQDSIAAVIASMSEGDLIQLRSGLRSFAEAAADTEHAEPSQRHTDRLGESLDDSRVM